jgi:hypothetical protein
MMFHIQAFRLSNVCAALSPKMKEATKAMTTKTLLLMMNMMKTEKIE